VQGFHLIALRSLEVRHRVGRALARPRLADLGRERTMLAAQGIFVGQELALERRDLRRDREHLAFLGLPFQLPSLAVQFDEHVPRAHQLVEHQIGAQQAAGHRGVHVMRRGLDLDPGLSAGLVKRHPREKEPERPHHEQRAADQGGPCRA